MNNRSNESCKIVKVFTVNLVATLGCLGDNLGTLRVCSYVTPRNSTAGSYSVASTGNARRNDGVFGIYE